MSETQVEKVRTKTSVEKKEGKEEIVIRNLQVRDIFIVANMLKKITGQKKEEIINLIKPLQSQKTEEGKEKTEEEEQKWLEAGLELGFYIFNLLLEYAEVDLREWFASLVGKNPQEFDQLPIDTPMVIVEKLGKDEDLLSFFQKAFGFYKKMLQSGTNYIKKSI
jgi:hypothetical protein